jgi:hypothetical protein
MSHISPAANPPAAPVPAAKIVTFETAEARECWQRLLLGALGVDGIDGEAAP